MIAAVLYCIAFLVVFILYDLFKPSSERKADSDAWHLSDLYKINSAYSLSTDIGQIVARIPRKLDSNDSVASLASLYSYNGDNKTVPVVKFVQTLKQNFNSVFRQKMSPKLNVDKFDMEVAACKCFDDLTTLLSRKGLMTCDIVIGVDFTSSNEWKGRRTFNSQSLHKTLGTRVYNPYQRVIAALAKVLAGMCSMRINAYGFGDAATTNQSVFAFNHQTQYFISFDQVLARYGDIAKSVKLSGPTSFAPIINKAVELVIERGTFHILFIIADGKVSPENEIQTMEAVENASNHPLSIVMIGVGDGPWETMIKYDELLRDRRFDNFKFVDYHNVMKVFPNVASDLAFALEALMEVPRQYAAIKQFGYL